MDVRYEPPALELLGAGEYEAPSLTDLGSVEHVVRGNDGDTSELHSPSPA